MGHRPPPCLYQGIARPVTLRPSDKRVKPEVAFSGRVKELSIFPNRLNSLQNIDIKAISRPPATEARRGWVPLPRLPLLGRLIHIHLWQHAETLDRQAHENAELNAVELLEQPHLTEMLNRHTVTMIDVERVLYAVAGSR